MTKKESDLGNKAEKALIKFLNNKNITHLKNCRLKDLILSSADKKDNIQNLKIFCKKYIKKDKKTKGNPKIDIIIYIGKKKVTLSIKTGKTNSLHEEPEKTFIEFLKRFKNSDKYLPLISKHLREEINIRNTNISKFFDDNKIEIIKRVLNGRFDHNNEDKLDFYYATKTLNNINNSELNDIIINGYFSTKENLFNYMCKNKRNKKNAKQTTCDVGILGYQSYNRNKGAKPQFKWDDPYNDLKKIYKDNEK